MDTIHVLWTLFVLLSLIEVGSPALLPAWRHVQFRQIYAFITAIGLACVSAGLLAVQPHILIVILLVISMYRIINMLRVIENRANTPHLQKITVRTSIVLVSLQYAGIAVQYLLSVHPISANTVLYIVAIVQLATAIIFFASTLRRMKKTQTYTTTESLANSELPTVTVAIPARNETEALEECLHALIASDYPKLEILVLDDCSQAKRTPEIIRSFAHDGVRFVKGAPPEENWLAKNQAYEKLSREASGEILIFCGVDTRFASGTVRHLVLELLGRQKRMMSFVPQRSDDGKPQLSFVQAARYLWELTPPRRLFRRPPVLSSCWMIYRKDLKKLGDFDAVSRMIIPEAYFAKKLLEKDGYSFVRAGRELGLVSTKTYAAQHQTAIRTRYPQLHKRPENVLILTLLELLCFVGPCILVILGIMGYVSLTVALLALISFVLLSACHAMVVLSTGLQSWYIAVWGFLPTVVTDIALMHVSMQRYEFSEVLWKGRNICVPVMHVYASLPKLDPRT